MSRHLRFLSTQIQVTEKTAIPQLTLYTGSDCQLCQVAKAVLDDLGKEIQFELKEYNIRDNDLEDVKKWRRAYQYDIPVLHLEGIEIARHRLNRGEVKSKILEMIRERG